MLELKLIHVSKRGPKPDVTCFHYVILDVPHRSHYNDVIMGAIASQITSLTIVYSIVYSDADQRKHQSSASRGPVNSPHKWPVTRKMFPFADVIMPLCLLVPRSTVKNIYSDCRICITFQNIWQFRTQKSNVRECCARWEINMRRPMSTLFVTV